MPSMIKKPEGINFKNGELKLIVNSGGGSNGSDRRDVDREEVAYGRESRGLCVNNKT